MNPTNICWCTHTFNPVTGCLRNCKGFDCYAKEQHDMRHKAYLDGKKLSERYKYPFNEMHFWPESFKNQPKKSTVIKKCFIGSVSDICYWEKEWIWETIKFCKERPGIVFMFCTKDPEIYLNHQFPLNCWLGATITKEAEYERMFELWTYSGVNKTFLSIEPLMGKFIYNFDAVDLVIVGADSSKNPVIPKPEWIDSIKHHNIHYKKNIQKYL
jgi:protein gp37